MAEPLQHLLRHPVHVGCPGGIAGEGQGVPAQGPYLLGHFVDSGGGQGADRHIGAGLGKGQGDAFANAAPASDDQYFLACNVKLGDAHPALPFYRCVPS